MKVGDVYVLKAAPDIEAVLLQLEDNLKYKIRNNGELGDMSRKSFLSLYRKKRYRYSVEYISGIGEGKSKHRFDTLQEVQAYVKGRWEGPEYIDGASSFHNDYGTFVLTGVKLGELGKRGGKPGTDEYWDWEWIDLTNVLGTNIGGT